MSTWTVTPINQAAITRNLERLISDTRDSVLARLRRGAEQAYAGTRFQGTFLVQADALFSSDPLFVVVEEPTKPHVIAARNAPYLWFKGNRGWVRVQSVNHPGTHGKRLLTPLFDVFGADVGAQLGRGWESLDVE
jgi:hypothetical protein